MIAVAKVLAYPDDRLRQVSRPIPIDDVATMRMVRNLVFTLRQTMYDAKGWGISAIQLGVPVRVCIVHVPDERSNPLIMVNPMITGISAEKITLNEGCLSFQGRREQIERPARVTMKRWDEFGHYAEPQEFEGWTARAILHELEHLDGRLLIDHLLPAAQRMLNRSLSRKAAKHAVKIPA